MSKQAHSGDADMDAIERQGRKLDEQESRAARSVNVETAPEEKEFIVLGEGKHVYRRHTKIDVAVREAHRLARLFPEKRFTVCKVKGSVIKAEGK